MTTYNKILVNHALPVPYMKNGKVRSTYTVTPGDFVRRHTDGSFYRQSVANNNGARLIAVEFEEIGKGIDDNYTTTEHIKLAYLQRGDEVYTFVAPSAAAIVIGDELVFDGSGGVKKKPSALALGASSLTGSVTGTMANISALSLTFNLGLALSTGDTYADASVNTAVNTAVNALDTPIISAMDTVIAAVNLQLKELATALEAAALVGANAAVVATALEAVDNSGDASNKARILVEMV